MNEIEPRERRIDLLMTLLCLPYSLGIMSTFRQPLSVAAMKAGTLSLSLASGGVRSSHVTCGPSAILVFEARYWTDQG